MFLVSRSSSVLSQYVWFKWFSEVSVLLIPGGLEVFHMYIVPDWFFVDILVHYFYSFWILWNVSIWWLRIVSWSVLIVFVSISISITGSIKIIFIISSVVWIILRSIFFRIIWKISIAVVWRVSRSTNGIVSIPGVGIWAIHV